MTDYYMEKINRWVVEKMAIKLDDQYRAEMRINGLDPDDHWTLVWSFETKYPAYRQMWADQKRSTLYRYRVRDLGEAQEVRRAIW